MDSDLEHNGKSLAIIFGALFLMMLGFGIILPVLPFYSETLGARGFELGLLLTIYALCQFIFAPVWGNYSDRVGRKPVLFIGVLGFAITFIFFGLANSLWMLFAARIAGGILSSAAMPTAMAYIGDITSIEKRASSMGLIGAAMGMGMIFGPALGGMLSDISLSFPFFFAAGLAGLNGVSLILFVKESLPPEKRTSTGKHMLPGFSLLQGLKTPLATILLVIMMVSLAEAIHHATFALFMEAKLSMGSKEIGWAFMSAGLVSIGVQGILVGRIVKYLGEETMIKIGIIIIIFSFILLLKYSYNLYNVILYMGLFAIGIGLIRPSVTTVVSKQALIEQGRYMGIMQGFDSLGRVIGPTLGGFVLDLNLHYPYSLSILISSIAFIFLWINTCQKKEV